MTDCIVRLSQLTRRFKNLTAVNKVDLEIGQGEIFGLLGPNGAGKTTIIKMLCTILNPSAGKASVCGHDIMRERDSVRRSIGVVFQDPSTDEELTAYENLMFHARIYGMTGDVQGRINEVLKLVELSDKRDQLVREFSGGMKRRLEIARGLMHRPRVLFLDEPTLGLDPQTRSNIWDYIANLNTNERITIILTTHYMDEADRLCERIGIIDNGSIIALDSPGHLKDSLQGDTIEVTTDEPEKLKGLISSMASKVTVHDHTLTLSVQKSETKIPLLVSLADKNSVKITSITMHKPTLEDVFLHFTGKAIRETNGDAPSERMRMMQRSRRR
jgi:ABC-2 type transport system ATP-binding protein